MFPNAIFCHWYLLGSYGQIGSYLVLSRLGRYFEICLVFLFFGIMDAFQKTFGGLYSSRVAGHYFICLALSWWWWFSSIYGHSIDAVRLSVRGECSRITHYFNEVCFEYTFKLIQNYYCL